VQAVQLEPEGSDGDEESFTEEREVLRRK